MSSEKPIAGAGESSPAPDGSAFDLETVYDAEISPLMRQVIAICKRVNMPMLATFCYGRGRDADDPDKTDYCTTCLPRGYWQSPEITEAMRIIYSGASCRPKLMALTVTHGPNDRLQRPGAAGGTHGL